MVTLGWEAFYEIKEIIVKCGILGLGPYPLFRGVTDRT